MVKYVLSKRAQYITKDDISRLIPSQGGGSYCDLNITWQNNNDIEKTRWVNGQVKRTLLKRDITATLKSVMYTFVGEPALIVELDELGNGGTNERQ